MGKKELVAEKNYNCDNEEKEEYSIYDYYNDEIYKEYIKKYANGEDIKNLDETEWKILINIVRKAFCFAEHCNVKKHVEIGGGLYTGYKSLSIDDLKFEIEKITHTFNIEKTYRYNKTDLTSLNPNDNIQNENETYVKKLKNN